MNMMYVSRNTENTQRKSTFVKRYRLVELINGLGSKSTQICLVEHSAYFTLSQDLFCNHNLPKIKMCSTKCIL